MALNVHAIVQNLSFSANQALLDGRFPIEPSPVRQQLHQFGLVDSFGTLSALGKAATEALKKTPGRRRKHKYAAVACFVTADLQIVLCEMVARDGSVKKVEQPKNAFRFDSLKEGRRYIALVQTERAGLISQLRRQVVYPLYAIDSTVVARYVADFEYLRDGRLIVEDAKGVKTKIFRLKKKWLKAQEGIEIVEV